MQVTPHQAARQECTGEQGIFILVVAVMVVAVALIAQTREQQKEPRAPSKAACASKSLQIWSVKSNYQRLNWICAIFIRIWRKSINFFGWAAVPTKAYRTAYGSGNILVCWKPSDSSLYISQIKIGFQMWVHFQDCWIRTWRYTMKKILRFEHVFTLPW